MPYEWRGTKQPHPNQVRWETDQAMRDRQAATRKAWLDSLTEQQRKEIFGTAFMPKRKAHCAICGMPGHTHNQCHTLVTVRVI